MIWGLVPAVEAVRSLATLPWETWLRRALPERPESALPLRRAPQLEPPRPKGEPGRTDLPLLGSTEWTVPTSWSVDPVSGHDFGDGPSRHVRARPELEGVDLLRCWVRGRGSDLLDAASWAATGEASAAGFVDLWLESFLGKVPPGRGPQWSSAMEVALRAVRLLAAAGLLAGTEAPERRRALFDEALRRHETWLRRHSDWRAAFTGNHFLIATAGRFLLAASLASTPRRLRDARRAWRLFWRELRRQVLPDGLHFESATHYHLLVLDAALQVLELGCRAGLALSERTRSRLVAAVRATAALARPDGSVAAIGDSDDGAFLAPAAGALEDARPLLARAAGLLGTSPEPTMRPACFVHGGLVVLALSGKRPVHVTVSATPRGRGGTGGHGHDDCGSYELWAGRPLVVDRGTGSYTGDPRLRERLRAARSHSLLVADGRTQNPAVRGRPFRRRERARPVIVSFDSEGGGAVELGHHAWCQGADALSVFRRLGLGGDGALRVRDEVRGHGEHLLELRVQWAPGLEPGPVRSEGEDLELAVCRGAETACTLRVTAKGASLSHEVAEHARRQGRVSTASASVASLRGRPPFALDHVVAPPWCHDMISPRS